MSQLELHIPPKDSRCGEPTEPWRPLDCWPLHRDRHILSKEVDMKDAVVHRDHKAAGHGRGLFIPPKMGDMWDLASPSGIWVC